MELSLKNYLAQGKVLKTEEGSRVLDREETREVSMRVCARAK